MILFEQDYSKTRDGARNHSRSGVYHSFINENYPVIFNGQIPLGDPSVDQSQIGVDYPSIQAAIDDLSSATVIPVGGILMTEFDDDPSGQSQIDLISVSGVASEDYVYIYGIKVPVTIGDNASEVTTAIITKLNEYVASGELFLQITQIDSTSFEVEYIDMRPHTPVNYGLNGITLTGSVQTQVRPGFGTWSQLGTTEIVTGTTVYVWKRTS